MTQPPETDDDNHEQPEASERPGGPLTAEDVEPLIAKEIG